MDPLAVGRKMCSTIQSRQILVKIHAISLFHRFRLVNDGKNDIGKRDRQRLRKVAVEELRGYVS